MEKIIKYLKGLEKRTRIKLYLEKTRVYSRHYLGSFTEAYDFTLRLNLKYNDCAHTFSGTITDKTDLHNLKQAIADSLPLRLRRK